MKNGIAFYIVIVEKSFGVYHQICAKLLIIVIFSKSVKHFHAATTVKPPKIELTKLIQFVPCAISDQKTSQNILIWSTFNLTFYR